MLQRIDYEQKYLTVVEEALQYSDMSNEQIIDAITELEGNHWEDSTDQYERYELAS